MIKQSTFLWLGLSIAICITLVLVFIYMNRASERSSEILIKSIATPIGIAIVILIWEFSQTLPSFTKEIYALIPSKEADIEFLSIEIPNRLDDHYQILNYCKQVDWPPDSEWTKFGKQFDERGPDWIGYSETGVYHAILSRSRAELAFLLWFSKQYEYHWQISNRLFEGLGGEGSSDPLLAQASRLCLRYKTFALLVLRVSISAGLPTSMLNLLVSPPY